LTLFLVGIALLLLAGAVCALPGQHARLAEACYRALVGAGCILVALPALRVLQGGQAAELRVQAGVPGGAWVFGIDPLSALFLVIIAAVGAASAFYGVTYLRAQRRAPLAHLCLTLLICALALVVTARAALPFLVAWECMAVSAYLLVVFDHEIAETRRAGLLYLVATHSGTLALILMFAFWGSGTSDLTFAALSTWRPPGQGALAAVLMLALLGFGLKAGLVPLHVWLPPAHAAAPSHVSALMSGVVIKMGIYGLLRVVELLGTVPRWWGWLLLAGGALSGILGVLWALAQHDLKRLLAFHSVENIGIIALGLGAGVLGIAYGAPRVAQLGFAGAALHTVNHALFKSLLFLGAGAVYRSTQTRAIDRLGGLARWMPGTAAAFLIGSIAIVGLPPLNGFVSEWLVFRALVQAGLSTSELRVAVLAAATLGLIGALALACFAKVVGIIYLGAPRSELDKSLREAPPGLLRPQFALAAGCIVIGLLPVLVLPPVLRVAAGVAHLPGNALAADAAGKTITAFALAVAAALAAAWVLQRALARRRPTGRAETWACGYPLSTSRMQYTASSFAAPLLVAYKPIAGISTRRTDDSFETHAVDPVLATLLRLGWGRVRALAGRVRPIQRGRLSVYLLYIVLTLVALLLYLLAEGRAP
jgi:formate hydrogenlyase subunit 3/multisubunit Na+/H+ antiporter MnhD subunit